MENENAMLENRSHAPLCEYKKRTADLNKQTNSTSNMRGGSLTRFRTDEAYGQDGGGLLKDILRGGLKGFTKSGNPLKVPTNTVSGLAEGLKRGVKRKAKEALKKEITKRAKQVLKRKDVGKVIKAAKRARDIFGV